MPQPINITAADVFEAYIANGEVPPYEIRLAYVAERVAEYGQSNGLTYPDQRYSSESGLGEVEGYGVRDAGALYPPLINTTSNIPQWVAIDSASIMPTIETDLGFIYYNEGAARHVDPASFWGEEEGIPVFQEGVFDAYMSAAHTLDCDASIRMAMFVADYDQTLGADIYRASGVQNLMFELGGHVSSSAAVAMTGSDLPYVEDLQIGDIIYMTPNGYENGPEAHIYMVIGRDENGEVLIAESTIDASAEFDGPGMRVLPAQGNSIYAEINDQGKQALSRYTVGVYRPDVGMSMEHYIAYVQTTSLNELEGVLADFVHDPQYEGHDLAVAILGLSGVVGVVDGLGTQEQEFRAEDIITSLGELGLEIEEVAGIINQPDSSIEDMMARIEQQVLNYDADAESVVTR